MSDDGDIQELVRTPAGVVPRRSISSVFLIILGIVASTPIFIAVWHALYENFLEQTPPTIVIKESPVGLGAVPQHLRFIVDDDGSGLDEVIVRIQQRKESPREIFKRSYNGQESAEESIDIGGEGSGIETGKVAVLIKAFDKSFWSNTSETEISIPVDYRRPKSQIVSAMHNARMGGSQLAFYRVFDADVESSGVKVGERYFNGFPASTFDPELEDKDLKVVLYAVDINEGNTELPVKLFSRDNATNISLTNFYNLVLPRKIRDIKVDYKHEQYRPVVVNDFTKITKRLTAESYWKLPFILPGGGIYQSFGDNIIRIENGVEVGRELIKGYGFKLSPNNRRVVAVSDGVVAAIERSKNLGSYVVIDHGLGLVSVYDRLGAVTVRVGDKVLQGDPIGEGEPPIGSKIPELYFELRVQGVPVDAREFWEAQWTHDHIKKKLNDIRKLSGLEPLLAADKSGREKRSSRRR